MDALQNIRDYLFEPIFTGVSFIIGLLYALLLAWGGFILAVMIIAAMFREKRKPSNIFAWSLAVLLLPWVGVPLYFLFGGRKSRRMVKIKKDFLRGALAAAGVRNLEELRKRHVEGNHCEMLADGVQTYEALLREIRQADHTIHVMTYILQRDTAGIDLVSALTERAREGVRVCLLMDSFGCLGNGGRWLRELELAGGEISRFMPLLPLHGHYSANLRNHRKLAIFDNRVVITGGQNLDLRFVGPVKSRKMFEDFSLRISGPVVQAFNFVFLSDWVFSTRQLADVFTESFRYRPAPTGDRQIEVIESGPEIEEDPLYDRILSLVQECRHNLTMVTPYFVPDEVLFRSLIVKARMKRRIRLILPRRSNHRLVDLARYHYLRKLNEAGVEIFFYMPRMLHGKLLIVDNEVALTGSANFDMRSLFVNFEMGIVHTSKADIEMLENWVEGLMPGCEVFHGNTASGLSVGRRFAENVAHLAGPML